jgi:hypothetical protein
MSDRQRYTIRRVGGARREVYLPYALRCVFAVECQRSITAPVWEQVTELEFMLLL